MYSTHQQAVPILPKTDTDTTEISSNPDNAVRTAGVRVCDASEGTFLSWRIEKSERREQAPKRQPTEREAQDSFMTGYQGYPTLKLSDLHHTTSSDWFGDVCIPADLQVFDDIDRAIGSQPRGLISSGGSSAIPDPLSYISSEGQLLVPGAQETQPTSAYELPEGLYMSIASPSRELGGPFDLFSSSRVTDDNLTFNEIFPLDLGQPISSASSWASYTQSEAFEPRTAASSTVVPPGAALPPQRFNHWINSSPSNLHPAGPHSTETTASSFSCLECNKEYHRKSDLAHHLRYHYLGAHQCKSCKKTFHFPKDLQRHSINHTRERQFPCRYTTCRYHNQGFKRKDHLRRHYKNVHHDSPEDPVLSCSELQQAGSERATTPKASSSAPVT